MRHRHGSPFAHHAQERPSFPLSLASEGEVVQIFLLPEGGKVQERLISMGLSLNDEVTVVQKQAGGALMIEKQGTRYVMGGGMAHKILVVRR